MAAFSASHHHQQQQQLFDAMYGELLAEARGTAHECGIDVRAIVFRPDGAAALPRGVMHEFRGVAPEARARQGMRKLVARDVSAMSTAELALHAARLQALRKAVVRKLRGKEEEKKAAFADREGMVKVKS